MRVLICTSIHESTKQTPVSLIFGQEMHLPIDVMFGLAPTTSSNPVCKLQYVADLRRHLEVSYALVGTNLVVAHEQQKKIYDQKRGGKIWCGYTCPMFQKDSRRNDTILGRAHFVL